MWNTKITCYLPSSGPDLQQVGRQGIAVASLDAAVVLMSNGKSGVFTGQTTVEPKLSVFLTLFLLTTVKKSIEKDTGNSPLFVLKKRGTPRPRISASCVRGACETAPAMVQVLRTFPGVFPSFSMSQKTGTNFIDQFEYFQYFIWNIIDIPYLNKYFGQWCSIWNCIWNCHGHWDHGIPRTWWYLKLVSHELRFKSH